MANEIFDELLAFQWSFCRFSFLVTMQYLFLKPEFWIDDYADRREVLYLYFQVSWLGVHRQLIVVDGFSMSFSLPFNQHLLSVSAEIVFHVVRPVLRQFSFLIRLVM